MPKQFTNIDYNDIISKRAKIKMGGNMLNGKIIVIEGTGDSGKQTQTKALKERLQKEGYNVFQMAFPNYSSQSSALVKMYLGGQIGKSPSDVSAEAASMTFALDRYITYKREIEKVYKEGKCVFLFDRYTPSNIIHQGCKVIDDSLDELENEEVLTKFILWLYNLEHRDLKIPKANKTIYLNVPVEYTIELRKDRSNKIVCEDAQDIHEADVDYLRKASKTGLMAAKQLDWTIIECVKDNKMRSIEDIAEEIYKKVMKD